MNARDDNINLAAEIATLFLFLAMIAACLCSGYVGAMYLIGEIGVEYFDGTVNWLEGIVAIICFLAPLILIGLASLGLRVFFVRKQQMVGNQKG